MKRDRYEWLPVTCAPEEYPVTIVRGTVSAGGLFLPVSRDAYLGNGWGEVRSVMDVGPDKKPVPDGIDVKWFAYRERKFYHVHASLDAMHIGELFAEGFFNVNTKKQEEYGDVILGFAPGGRMSIWLRGVNRTVEVGFLQGEEYAEDVKSFIGTMPDLDSFVRMATKGDLTPVRMHKITATTPDALKWSVAYRKKYRYKMAVSTSAPVSSVSMAYFNAEQFHWPSLEEAAKITGQVAPREWNVFWPDANNLAKISEIIFDEAEIFSALERLSKDGRQMTLHAEINRITRQVKVFLEDGEHLVMLEKCGIKTFKG